MDWRIKGIIQKVLSTVPGGSAANTLLQQVVGGMRNVDKQMDTKVEDWAIVAGHLNNLGLPIAGQRMVEVGTGWYPTLPICFYLAGTDACTTMDLHRLMSDKLTWKLMSRLERHLELIAKTANQPLAEVESRYRQLMEQGSVESLLLAAGITYKAPGDASQTGMGPASVDVCYSNSVFEHVTATAMSEILQENYRILTPGGVAIHSANCADHYAYFDKSISFMNYFQYTEAAWQRWNNDLQYQNRLRPCDMVSKAEEAGFEIVVYIYRPKEPLLALLPSLELAEEFQHYPPEQLACTSVDFVGRKES